MMSRAKPFVGSAISHRSPAFRLLFGTLVSALAVHAVACSGDVQDNRSTTATSASSSGAGGEGNGGTGGMGGSGASGGTGTGGGPMDGGPAVEYVGYNLFTHVPRFVIYKIDHTRNLCFRIWLEGFSGPGPLMIDVTDPWAASHAEVTNNVNDCVNPMGFPMQPMTLANATSGMGTIMIPGSFPCAVDVHTTISFDPIAPWVPASETFDVDKLNIDGGCG